jgi:hypothetical protein
MNNDNNFQPQSPTEPVQPQIAPSPVNTFGQPATPVAEPATQPVPAPVFDPAPIQPQPTQLQPTQPQPPVQPKPLKKGAPLWMWIALGVVVLLVGGAIAAVLLIK